MILFLFSTNCGRFKRDKESDTSKKPKIQKNSNFRPACGDVKLGYVKSWCSSGGEPACGTESGSGNLRVYCIDKDDTILKGKASCFNRALEQPRQPHCTQLIQSQ